ncbi:MAG: hypothetical protein JJ863_15320 [Deltaproteobacteria bacterium]|nr:hypothetical protein [Deltaproteobacteria bacterium]
MHRFATITLVALALTLTACGSRLVSVGPPRGGMVTQTDDPQAVRAALARALEARRFTIESEGEGKLIARLDHGARSLRVRVEYDTESYRIAYEGSDGFGYQIDPRTQEPVISPHYPRYVTTLDRTIQNELRRPAEEAREAEEARQQAIADAAEQERAEERAESRRARRRERRRERREAWAEMNREQQETERERLRTQRAEAEAEAERLRREPVPVFENHEPVYVERFAFDESRAHHQIRVRTGRGERVVRSHTQGRYSSRQLGLPAACPGFWSGEPQHYVTLQQDMDYLRVEIAAHSDTTLAVVTPSGQVWCDDDSAGNQNPRLEGRFPAGTYAIYVGTYQQNDRTRYALAMDETHLAPQPAPQRVARTQRVQTRRRQQTPDCRTSLLRAGHDASGLTFCRNAEPHCAAALFEAGHQPSSLVYCRNVQPACAVELLRAGQQPSGLVYCR